MSAASVPGVTRDPGEAGDDGQPGRPAARLNSAVAPGTLCDACGGMWNLYKAPKWFGMKYRTPGARGPAGKCRAHRAADDAPPRRRS